MRLINDESAFKLTAEGFDKEATAAWDSAIMFFEESEGLLKAIRNDIGGHFGQQAALNALDKLRPDAFGSIELVDGTEMRLQFAGEIAASALLPHLQNDDIKEYKALLRDCVRPAYQHAAHCVQVLAADLWERFGS